MSVSWRLGVFLAAFYPLLGFKRAFFVIGALLAVHGWILLLTRARELIQMPMVRQLAWIAGGFVVPLWLALPDVSNFEHAARETTMAMLYLPMLLSVAVLVARHDLAVPFMRSAVFIATLWSLDACVQVVCGRDLMGMPLLDRAGAYWQSPMKFGYYMGFFGLFAWVCDLQLNPGRLWRAIGLWLLITSGVLVGLNREAWLVYFPASVMIFWHLPLNSHPWRVWLALAMALLAAAFFGCGWVLSASFQARILQTLEALNGSYEALDAALSHRLGIWLPAWELSKTHWFNGMGQDGFLQAFQSVTPDPFHKAHGGGMYPHQVVLEVLTTAGLIGVIGIMIILITMWRVWQHGSVEARAMALPFLVYLSAIWFPVNTHRSFYSSELMMGNWMMLGFYVAILSGMPGRLRKAAAP